LDIVIKARFTEGVRARRKGKGRRNWSRNKTNWTFKIRMGFFGKGNERRRVRLKVHCRDFFEI